MTIYFVICPSGEPHPQTFQAGRGKFEAFDNNADAKDKCFAVNQFHPGHKVVAVKFERGGQQ